MSASNVKSLKQMGGPEMTHSFRFHDQEIAVLFDNLIISLNGVLGSKSVTTPGRVVIWWMLQQTISLRICHV